METTIINQSIGAIITIVLMYLGFINTLRAKVAVLESKVKELQEECKKATDRFEEIAHKLAVQEDKVKRLEQRQDSHAKKNDDIITLITEFKMEVMERIGSVNVQMGKIQSDVENINNTIAIFDSGIVSKKKKNN